MQYVFPLNFIWFRIPKCLNCHSFFFLVVDERSVAVLVVGGSSTGGDGVGDMNSTKGCG